jgi:hypothetical protein
MVGNHQYENEDSQEIGKESQILIVKHLRKRREFRDREFWKSRELVKCVSSTVKSL